MQTEKQAVPATAMNTKFKYAMRWKNAKPGAPTNVEEYSTNINATK